MAADSFGRFKREVLCMPRYCPYESVCRIRGSKQRKVFVQDCLRHAPPHRRPEMALSPFAQDVLLKLRRQPVARV